MFKQAICLTHYSSDFIERLEMLGYKNSKYSIEFSGIDKNTRDDLCICTSIVQSESDPNPVSYIILTKKRHYVKTHELVGLILVHIDILQMMKTLQ